MDIFFPPYYQPKSIFSIELNFQLIGGYQISGFPSHKVWKKNYLARKP